MFRRDTHCAKGLALTLALHPCACGGRVMPPALTILAQPWTLPGISLTQMRASQENGLRATSPTTPGTCFPPSLLAL